MISKPKIPYVHWGFIYKILPTLQIGRVPFRACVITVIQAVRYSVQCQQVTYSSEPHTPQHVPQEGRVLSVIQAALVFCSLHDANPLCHTHLSTFSRRGVCYHSHPSSLTLFCSVPAIDVFLCAIHTSVRSAGRACWS